MMSKFLSILFVILMMSLSTTAQAITKGDRVLGQWSDGYWYPARVNGVKGTQYQLNFDDGDVGTVSAAKIKKITWGVGTKLQCNWKNGGKYYPGKITSMKGEMVHISYKDGDQEDITISRCRRR